jgi:hypothetical protein
VFSHRFCRPFRTPIRIANWGQRLDMQPWLLVDFPLVCTVLPRVDDRFDVPIFFISWFVFSWSKQVLSVHWDRDSCFGSVPCAQIGDGLPIRASETRCLFVGIATHSVGSGRRRVFLLGAPNAEKRAQKKTYVPLQSWLMPSNTGPKESGWSSSAEGGAHQSTIGRL